jgi:SNF2 family DNA or RNA helicase
VIEQTKFKAGRYRLPVTLKYEGGRIYVKFPFSRTLISEVKMMAGARWHGFDETNPRKLWSIEDCPRNHFQMAYLKGENPYAHFDQPIIEYDYTRPLYNHQKQMTNFMLTRRHCIVAGEMGVGKTLSAIESMERSGFMNWWYVAPKSGLRAVNRELLIWKSKVKPRMMTYEALVKWMKEHEGLTVQPPMGVIFDESARVKNPTALRSQAAMMLANGIRADYGYEGRIILMSGAPAPKDPVDWWHQCEVACPGFLQEGTQMKCRKRLGIITNQESEAGGIYPVLNSWLDDGRKCATCGEDESSTVHDEEYCEKMGDPDDFHEYKQSINEVAKLNRRMDGLVTIKLKKDCLDLPPIIYRTIELPPTQKILNIAKTLIKTAKTVISGLTLMRELSDGFQYKDEQVGTTDCKICEGSGDMQNPLSEEKDIISCDGCGGAKQVPVYARKTVPITCPKTDALVDILDEHIDIGRLTIYAGFTGSIDHCVDTCKQCGWDYVRADGRGWVTSVDNDIDPLDLFQDMQKEYPRVAFIGQPGAAGEGLTLTASPTILYYSNTFDGNHRIQSSNRGHRPGMDLERGCTIIDLLHLPTDHLILENLTKKMTLQGITMGDITTKLGAD